MTKRLDGPNKSEIPAPESRRRVVLCADDYGLSPGIGVAIRDLLALGRISATSCMTAGPYWPAEADLLKPFIYKADLGLHLTLTDQSPAGPCPRLAPNGRLPALPKLVTAALFGQLPLDEIEAEIHRQIDRFEAEMGRPPDHIDGHQHVHGLPGIRTIVARAAARRLTPRGYVRITDAPLGFLIQAPSGLRAAIVTILGHGLTGLIDQAGIRRNRTFSGVRGFQEKVPYLDLIKSALALEAPELLVMCHPGVKDDVLSQLDSVVDQRVEEYQTLKSDAFGAVLAQSGIAIGRL
jgi:predicted glycoside hydrolase/deacetylase ChbG (UPF0249 family)